MSEGGQSRYIGKSTPQSLQDKFCSAARPAAGSHEPAGKCLNLPKDHLRAIGGGFGVLRGAAV